MFTMRFDMRAPEGAATTPGLYEAAVDMAEWAEDRGGVMTVISEHHASPDGYLPSPLLLASAMVARTTRMPIMVGAALMPFYDPIRLAEDMAVLDIMSDTDRAAAKGRGWSRSQRGRKEGERSEDRCILYWHTFSSAPLAPLLLHARKESEIPWELQQLLLR